MSTSCGWEGKGRYGSFRLRMNVWVCTVQVKLWNPWEHVPYLSASAVAIHYEEALYQVCAPLPLPLLRAKLSGAVYCNRSCLWVCAWVLCVLWVCYHDNSKLRASILTKLGLWVKVVTVSSWLNFGRPAPPGRGSVAVRKLLAPPYYSQRTVFASLWADWARPYLVALRLLWRTKPHKFRGPRHSDM